MIGVTLDHQLDLTLLTVVEVVALVTAEVEVTGKLTLASDQMLIDFVRLYLSLFSIALTEIPVCQSIKISTKERTKC